MHPLVKNTIKFFLFLAVSAFFILVGLPGSELG